MGFLCMLGIDKNEFSTKRSQKGTAIIPVLYIILLCLHKLDEC